MPAGACEDAAVKPDVDSSEAGAGPVAADQPRFSLAGRTTVTQLVGLRWARLEEVAAGGRGAQRCRGTKADCQQPTQANGQAAGGGKADR